MASASIKHEVLQILADNIKNNSSPQAVSSETIAWKIGISLGQLGNVLKCMHQSGTIISDLENHHSIITSAGMDLLQDRYSQQVRIEEGVSLGAVHG